jgi:hypothetical protein
MNIKKILAGGLAAIAAGATISFGVLGAGLGDYVQPDTGQLLSPMVVIGGSPTSPVHSADVLGGIDIGVALAGYATKSVSIAGAEGIPSASNGALISSDLNKTYIGEVFSNVKSTLTSTELPVLLAPTTFTDMNNTKSTITQQIVLGGQVVAYGRPGTETDPALYVTFGPNYNYNLTVLFIGGLDTSAIDSTYTIKLFSKDYTFGSTTTGQALDLYSSSGAQTLTFTGTTGTDAEGSVTIGGDTYNFKLNGYVAGTPNKAVFSINGQATSPTEWSAGSTYTIPGTDVSVYVKSVSIVYTDPQTAYPTVQLFVGTDKLELIHGQNVEKNDESMSQVKAYFDNSTYKINSITLEVAPDINTYLMDGGEYVDPLFGSFKWVVGGTTPAKDSQEQVNIVQDGSNKVKVTFTNKDGTVYNIDVFYRDTQNNVWKRSHDGTYNFWVQEANVTDGSAQENENMIKINDMFVVASNYNTYVLKYLSYHTSSTASLRYVTLQDVSTLTKYDIYYNSDSYLRIGSEKYNVSMRDYGNTFGIAVDLNGDTGIDGPGGATSADTVNITTRGQGAIELSSNNSIVLWEVPLYTISQANEPAYSNVNVTAGWSSNDMSFVVGGPSTTQVGTSNKYMGMTAYGTLVETDTDADTVYIWYPGKRPGYANVAVGSDPTITIGGGASGTVEQAVKITQPIAKFASEVTSPETITSDLILIGGPCANSLVATLMETTLDTCFDDFKAYNGGITEGIIKEFTNAFGSGKKALVVAGMNAADTRAMAAKVMQGTLSYQA